MLPRRGFLASEPTGQFSETHEWIIKATHYLTSGLGEVFYADATDDAKIAHNRAVPNTLKAVQQEALASFIAANGALLTDLASAIEDKLSLSRDEIRPFLERVVFTPEVPRCEG